MKNKNLLFFLFLILNISLTSLFSPLKGNDINNTNGETFESTYEEYRSILNKGPIAEVDINKFTNFFTTKPTNLSDDVYYEVMRSLLCDLTFFLGSSSEQDQNASPYTSILNQVLPLVHKKLAENPTLITQLRKNAEKFISRIESHFTGKCNEEGCKELDAKKLAQTGRGALLVLTELLYKGQPLPQSFADLVNKANNRFRELNITWTTPKAFETLQPVPTAAPTEEPRIAPTALATLDKQSTPDSKQTTNRSTTPYILGAVGLTGIAFAAIALYKRYRSQYRKTEEERKKVDAARTQNVKRFKEKAV